MWMWIVGAVILAGGAVAPPFVMRRRSARRAYLTARDRARSAMSRLEWALDQVGEAGGGDAGSGSGSGAPGHGSGSGGDARGGPRRAERSVAEARRCHTLAGSALAGTDTTDGFRQAEDWARRGLSALGTGTGTGTGVGTGTGAGTGTDEFS